LHISLIAGKRPINYTQVHRSDALYKPVIRDPLVQLIDFFILGLVSVINTRQRLAARISCTSFSSYKCMAMMIESWPLRVAAVYIVPIAN
jgi:hypothetical protein